jgi:hypothetical protein
MYHLQQVNLTPISQHHKTHYLKITEGPYHAYKFQRVIKKLDNSSEP